MITNNERPEGKIDPEYRDTDLDNNAEDTVDSEDLNFNEAEGSFEYDVKGDDPDYDHPDPYDTTVKNGEDISSTYDEANPYDTKGEYDAARSIETDADSLGMHIDSGKIVELDPLDARLAHTPEDDRDDLDEEGYPKNDTPEGFK
ncbi:hypothetical protein IDJ77_23430 [Mucilaginibacter sp. ZT4R22]|uniref:Uncharacterized protein n=1 Tax=Mucilaginibacter pankratovii TaxID=2772110 RepID=A0ABR7WX69_9SPHI|nr:hypothetical protein [Mucilaginibacter pankratovii]MBD1366783.1 hypothetical protein [Mucilaginibacter pankratovii]